MALVVKDRVKETTTTTGTGTITLAGAVSGFQSFSVIGDANTTYYAIVGGTQWEVGIGAYTLSGTTLSRDTVLESSTGGTKVDFAAGTKDVFVTYPAEESVDQDTAQTLTNKTFDGGTVVTANSSATALRITQTGAGNALVVEDSANPDSTPFVVNASGNVGIGTTAPSVALDVVGTIEAQAALTQDAVAIAGRAGGTSSYVATITPTTLTASRTITLPDNSGTVLTTGATVTVGQGGTGQTSYTDGQLLIGNSTGNTLTKATLTAGSGISITNGAGSITIATSASAADVQTFTSSGTWTKPATGQFVTLEFFGAGAGGGNRTSTGAAGGGGGGGYSSYTIPFRMLPSTLSITIGAGGAGGSRSSAAAGGTNGANGGRTFTSFTVMASGLQVIGAEGGSAGITSTTATAQAGGGGGRGTLVTSSGCCVVDDGLNFTYYSATPTEAGQGSPFGTTGGGTRSKFLAGPGGGHASSNTSYTRAGGLGELGNGGNGANAVVTGNNGGPTAGGGGLQTNTGLGTTTAGSGGRGECRITTWG